MAEVRAEEKQKQQASAAGAKGLLSDPFARIVIVTSIAILSILIGSYVLFQLVQAGVSPMIVVTMILGSLVIVMFGEVLPSFIENEKQKKIARMAGGLMFAVFLLIGFVLYYSSYHTSIAQLELSSLSGALLIGAIVAAFVIVIAVLVYKYHRGGSARRTAIATY